MTSDEAITDSSRSLHSSHSERARFGSDSGLRMMFSFTVMTNEREEGRKGEDRGKEREDWGERGPPPASSVLNTLYIVH
ncbi:unnamed protein product [Angiostrongylus costaricensis]|uniref:Uncharacterized protein n=1 Tax=Angiostrongylus costaricensis TaxID=334426 RepID=A0A0R3PKV5_ANGCS|nr:unnamed protein product [Angiostrongylus costaricensis]